MRLDNFIYDQFAYNLLSNPLLGNFKYVCINSFGVVTLFRKKPSIYNKSVTWGFDGKNLPNYFTKVELDPSFNWKDSLRSSIYFRKRNWEEIDEI